MTVSEEQRGRRRNAGFELRLSAVTWVILATCALEVVLTVLALVLPWGISGSGADIKLGLAGLLPWFAFVPVLLQLAFCAVASSLFQILYILADVIIGVFIILVQYLSFVKYESFKPGFFVVFVVGGLVVLAGLVCVVERRAFPRLEAAGRARRVVILSGERGSGRD